MTGHSTAIPGRASLTVSVHVRRTRSVMNQIQILVADNHPVVRKGIVSYLARDPRFAVVAEAVDGLDALAKVRDLCPNVVLMDILMPKLDGLSATEALRKENPWLKILIFADHASAHDVQRILTSGASGYLPKSASLEQLAQAVRAIAEGKDFYNLDVAEQILQRIVVNGSRKGLKGLTPREREVLAGISDGLNNKELGTRLGINQRTVKSHRQRMMHKLNIRNVAGLTRFALKSGLVSLTPGRI